ncbi:MAG: hypothetical protein ACRDRH_13750 [Pseudonocardia sp.]
MADRARDRAAWLEGFTTVLPPVTLVVALLVYFGWVLLIARSSALGFDVTILAEASIPAHLIRSVGALYFPLVVLTVVALTLLWLDRRLRARLDDRRRLRSLLRLSGAVPVVVVALGLIAAVLSLNGPVLRAYAVLAAPFLLAAAVLAFCYGNSLRRAVRGRLPTRRDRVLGERRFAGSLLSGFLVALLLFAGVDGFAKVVGRGLARQVVENPAQYTKPVLLYSRDDLQLDPADAMRTVLANQEQDGYHYRYEGLRLVFVDSGSYFLIPLTWQRSQGKLIVLREDGLRIEFIR